jgi:hypothetical protein
LTGSGPSEKLAVVPAHRLLVAVVCVVAATGAGSAQCPPSCAGGGGPPATDCFLAYDSAPAKVIACTEGDPACDLDGRIDGVCTFGFAACTNVALGACPATVLDGPPLVIARGRGAERFVAAVRSLPTSAPACTDAGLVALAIAPSAKRLKPAKLTLRLTARAAGRKDKDRFRLLCHPARTSLAAHVQPIFTATCTYVGCHAGALPEQELSLEDGKSAAGLAERALLDPRQRRVEPGSLRKSYLTRSVLGVGARQMPDGCPDEIMAPVERCLTSVEVYTILSWIQGGAQP